MRENRMKNILITGIILLSIVFLIFFNYYYYFVSPKMVEINKLNEIVELFEKKEKKEVLFYARYFADEEYYSASDEEKMYLFNEEGTLLKEVIKSNLNFDAVKEIASEKYETSSISLAIYEDEVVYVIVSEKEDLFLSLDELEEVFKFRKGI